MSPQWHKQNTPFEVANKIIANVPAYQGIGYEARGIYTSDLLQFSYNVSDEIKEARTSMILFLEEQGHKQYPNPETPHAAQ